MTYTAASKPVMLVLSAAVSPVGIAQLINVGVTIITDPVDALLEEVWLITDENDPISILLEEVWLITDEFKAIDALLEEM